MSTHVCRTKCILCLLLLPTVIQTHFSRRLFPHIGVPASQQPATDQNSIIPQPTPTQADILLGAYGPYRANNDLLYYHLNIRADPTRRYVTGRNTIRLRMLKSDTRIQIDLHPKLTVLFGATPLKYEREFSAVFIDFPETLEEKHIYTIDFYFSGYPLVTSLDPADKGQRWGGIGFQKDPSGHDWVNTVCQGVGSSTWWPSKDQWRDKVDNMDISVEAPSDLMDVSNGKFQGKTDLGDGYTRWDWHVSYPINNYSVSVNIVNYVHFSDYLGDIPLDYYVLPEDLEKAQKQFVQAKTMLRAYGRYFGEYPFKKDGYKLIQAPNAGMEHQSAVTYGNLFKNGYLGRDWTGVGISLKFDFIIVHESAHEWFGNSVTAADRSDMWIHEGWATYLESLYVEYLWGKTDGIRYLNGLKPKVKDQPPIITGRGINGTPPENQYFKGALFLGTLRSVVNDDRVWFEVLRNFYQRFRYKTIMTEDITTFFNQQLHTDLTPIFDQYLRHRAIPILELKFDESAHTVSYRWKVDEPDFAMPIRVGAKAAWQLIKPTTIWQTMPTSEKMDDFEVDTDRYYVGTLKTVSQGVTRRQATRDSGFE